MCTHTSSPSEFHVGALSDKEQLQKVMLVLSSFHLPRNPLEPSTSSALVPFPATPSPDLPCMRPFSALSDDRVD